MQEAPFGFTGAEDIGLWTLVAAVGAGGANQWPLRQWRQAPKASAWLIDWDGALQGRIVLLIALEWSRNLDPSLFNVLSGWKMGLVPCMATQLRDESW